MAVLKDVLSAMIKMTVCDMSTFTSISVLIDVDHIRRPCNKYGLLGRAYSAPQR